MLSHPAVASFESLHYVLDWLPPVCTCDSRCTDIKPWYNIWHLCTCDSRCTDINPWAAEVASRTGLQNDVHLEPVLTDLVSTSQEWSRHQIFQIFLGNPIFLNQNLFSMRSLSEMPLFLCLKEFLFFQHLPKFKKNHHRSIHNIRLQMIIDNQVFEFSNTCTVGASMAVLRLRPTSMETLILSWRWSCTVGASRPIRVVTVPAPGQEPTAGGMHRIPASGRVLSAYRPLLAESGLPTRVACLVCRRVRQPHPARQILAASIHGNPIRYTPRRQAAVCSSAYRPLLADQRCQWATSWTSLRTLASYTFLYV